MSQSDIDVKTSDTVDVEAIGRCLNCPDSAVSCNRSRDAASSSPSTTASSPCPADLPAIEDLAARARRRHGRRPRRRADVGRPGPPARRRSRAGRCRRSPSAATSPTCTCRPTTPRATSSTMPRCGPIRLDAAALLINLLDADDDPSVRQACLRNVFAAKAAVRALRAAADGRADPVRAPRRPLLRRRRRGTTGAARAPGRRGRRRHRQGRDPPRRGGRCAGRSGSAATCRTSPAAGPRVTTARCSTLTRHLLDCGAAGVVFGRNIFQHERPAAMAAALKALIHDDASTETRRGRAVVTGRDELFLLAVDHRRSFERLFGIDEPVGAPTATGSSRPRRSSPRRSATSPPNVGQRGDGSSASSSTISTARRRSPRRGGRASPSPWRSSAAARRCSSSSTPTGAIGWPPIRRLRQGADPPPCRRRSGRRSPPSSSGSAEISDACADEPGGVPARAAHPVLGGRAGRASAERARGRSSARGSSSRRSPRSRTPASLPTCGRSRASPTPPAARRSPRRPAATVATTPASWCSAPGRGVETVNRWLEAAAAGGYSGFAVGRSIWADAVLAHDRGELDAAAARAQIADRYGSFIDTFQRRRLTPTTLWDPTRGFWASNRPQRERFA